MKNYRRNWTITIGHATADWQRCDDICSREQTKKLERFQLVRGEFFRQSILTNHVVGFLFSHRANKVAKWKIGFNLVRHSVRAEQRTILNISHAYC